MYFPLSQIRGVSVQHKGRLFPMNFTQQNSFIDLLNQCTVMQHGKAIQSEKAEPSIEKIFLHHFSGDDTMLTPFISGNLNELGFEVSSLTNPLTLIDRSKGDLTRLLVCTFDP